MVLFYKTLEMQSGQESVPRSDASENVCVVSYPSKRSSTGLQVSVVEIGLMRLI